MEDGIVIIIQLLFVVIIGVGCMLIAKSKGRNQVGWFFGGFFLGLLGLIIIACLPNLKEKAERDAQLDRENRRLREQLRQERIKADSFRQHTQTRLDTHDAQLGVDTRSTAPLLEATATPDDNPLLTSQPTPRTGTTRSTANRSAPSPSNTSAP